MAYVDGFIIPVKNEDKASFVDHAERMDSIFLEMGATRVIECWADDVAHGTTTDFYRAVQCSDDETVVFSWIEWPDKPTRDAAMDRMREDARLMSEPMPFDGKRMIFGGFVPVVTLGE